MTVGSWSHALSRAGRDAHQWLDQQGSMPQRRSAWTGSHATAAAPASAARPPAADLSAAALLSAAHPAPPEGKPQDAVSKAMNAPASAACLSTRGPSAEVLLCAACPAPPKMTQRQSVMNTPHSAIFRRMSEASISLSSSCIAPSTLLYDSSNWQRVTVPHYARRTTPYVPAASSAGAGLGSLHEGGFFSGLELNENL